MRIARTFLTLMAIVAHAASASPTFAQSSPRVDGAIYGVWRNPKNTVHVDVKPCGEGACGVVVWADAEAQADARKGGTPNLIGLQLFRNFNQQANGRWRGRVFVPDLNATFSGTAELVDGNRLKARGCLFANIACKSQTWVRLSAPG